jgi:hypothetical protein
MSRGTFASRAGPGVSDRQVESATSHLDPSAVTSAHPQWETIDQIWVSSRLRSNPRIVVITFANRSKKHEPGWPEE